MAIELLQLPSEVLVRALSFLGEPVDLISCSIVNTAFRHLIDNTPGLWEDIAVREYGNDIAREGLNLHYGGNWKDLVLDKNRRGAWKVHKLNIPCFWKYNPRTDWFYCCIVESILWDRHHRLMHLLIDARGESDLRHPIPSKLVCDPAQLDVQPVFPPIQYLSDRWTSLLEPQRPGRYRGYLTYPESVLRRSTVKFCYANDFGPNSSDDYLTISLFDRCPTTIQPRNPNKDIPWDGYTSSIKLVEEKRNESIEIQRARWVEVLRIPEQGAAHILDRPGWWV